MTDTFNFSCTYSIPETIANNIRSAQFGDGYKQISMSGINPTSESWDLNNNSFIEEAKRLRDFLISHVATSFWWVNPWGERKLYRVKSDSIKTSFLNNQYITTSFTFEQAFAP